MPQIFQVLRCYKCLVFQVHQVKKSIKWQCKMCGEKQSVKRHYGIGTGMECRLHVQKLNIIRSDIAENHNCNHEEIIPDDITDNSRQSVKQKSKWNDFIDNQEIDYINEEESISMDDMEVVLKRPKPKLRKHYKKNTEQNSYSEVEVFDSNVRVESTLDIKLFDEDNICTTKSKCNKKQNLMNLIEDKDFNVNKSFKTKMFLDSDKHDVENLNLLSNDIEPSTSTASNYVKPKNTSKWDQYIIIDDKSKTGIDSDEALLLSNNNCTIQLNSKQGISLFSLSEEQDIDKLLNI